MPKLIGSRLFSRRFPLSIRNLVALNAKSALLRCIAAQQKLSPQDDTNIARASGQGKGRARLHLALFR